MTRGSCGGYGDETPRPCRLLVAEWGRASVYMVLARWPGEVSIVVFEREVVDEEHAAVATREVVAVFAGRSYHNDVGGDA